ncbi:conjugal transfer protein TraD [Phenylobacterium sp. J426]|nr:conjugal transfer protein TraD [Phenylobacterium sp. J426]MCR5873088.1 conjugal transfer protein TraD [Phenylobacterium sp. J426]
MAGVLLSAAEEKDASAKEAWRRKGAAFFQRARRSGASRNGSEEHARGAP